MLTRRAFTLIELLAAISILAILVTIAGFYIAGYTSTARQQADKQTLVVLNDALNRYKCQGGNLNALTSGTPIRTVLTKLQTPIDWAGHTHQVLSSGKTFIGKSISSKGDRQQYRFTRYNTYTEEAGGLSPGDLGPSSGSLVAWWKFDEVSGTTAADSSGNNHTGTISGTSSFVSSSHGNALSFDGSSTYVQIASPISFGDRAPWTFTAWVYWTNADDPSADLAGRASTFHLLSLRESDNNNRFWYRTGAPSYTNYYFTNGSTADLLNTWKHITFVCDGTGNLSVYKDGTLFQTLTGLPITSMYFSYLGAGYSTAATNLFGGYMDEVRIYNRALSADEVQQLYQMP